MKTLAIFLYGFAFLVSLAASDNWIPYLFPVFAAGVTLFLGITMLFLAVFKAAGSAKKAYTEHRDHKDWIL